MDLSLPNNKFCDPKFHTIFLIFMPLILSFEEVEEIKKKKTFKSINIPYPLKKKILKIQIFISSLFS